ncbi:MAG: hypothetical protein KQ78_01752 [Candidatus Izimaplasma bacterium HR2]|nr:MAG: hypothetical protein KQ78_01752 [Candidatus Izimaplasma bacterium HR2]
MKKLLLKIVLIQTIFMVGCVRNNEEIIEIKSDDLITMENLDDYMFRDDVQYVDLRNFESRFLSGFIYSFEVIPFFDYLDYRAFNRNDTYIFSPDQIINEQEMLRLFDKEKTIFLYADGCIRSGYIKDVLAYLEYDKVFVLGGFFEYDGEYKVLGDGSYNFGDTFYNSYYDENTELTYIFYGELDMSRKISEIRFDIINDDNSSIRSTYMINLISVDTELTILENYIVYDLVTFTELHNSLSNLDDSGYSSISQLDSTVIDNLLKLIEDFVPVK